MWEASMADQKAGGQGLDTRVTCISNGMPRMMTILRQLEIFITPWVTLVVFENNLPRRIYTDGRGWDAKDNLPSYNGYSIGKWIDEDGDGKYDVLEVETRNFKGPRNYEPSGIPCTWTTVDHHREDVHSEQSGHAVTRSPPRPRWQPWKVVKNHRREKDVEWHEDLCSENNNHVVIGKDYYFLSADGYLMPTKKDQRRRICAISRRRSNRTIANR
jgi:hypothetical protein